MTPGFFMIAKFADFFPRIDLRLWRLVTIFYALGILFVSIQPDLRPPESKNIIIEQTKNWLHVPAYAGLAFLLLCSFGKLSWRTRAAAFGIATGYGILNEWLQMSVTGRSGAWDDVARNALGALVTVWIFKEERKTVMPARLKPASRGDTKTLDSGSPAAGRNDAEEDYIYENPNHRRVRIYRDKFYPPHAEGRS